MSIYIVAMYTSKYVITYYHTILSAKLYKSCFNRHYKGSKIMDISVVDVKTKANTIRLKHIYKLQIGTKVDTKLALFVQHDNT